MFYLRAANGLYQEARSLAAHSSINPQNRRKNDKACGKINGENVWRIPFP